MSTTKNDKPAYQESEDHVANPMYQSGVVDTTGTTGDVGSRMDNVSPVFAQARRDALGNAADAVKNHPKGDLDHVVLPEDDLTRDAAQ